MVKRRWVATFNETSDEDYVIDKERVRCLTAEL